MHNQITVKRNYVSRPAFMADAMMFVAGLAVGVFLVLGALSIVA